MHNIHIEQRTTMSDEDALLYLQQCKVPARWTLTGEFRAMPDNAQNIRNSDGDWTQFIKVDEVIMSLRRKMPEIRPMVPKLVEAYYVVLINVTIELPEKFLEKGIVGGKEIISSVVVHHRVQADLEGVNHEGVWVEVVQEGGGFVTGREMPHSRNVLWGRGQERILGNKVETMGKLNGIDVV
ncbi:hypothetical protein F5879DRAFT_1026158 [Lentinula edodes]|nr:hypothetical protein F5879DRAFT_1026158 [Lentinula edodes]